LRKAEQLSQRLPFQAQLVQVPYENTLGGFAMFNTGVTDLAPQLNGWYGAEGIDVNNPTTVFLVGDHFSVLNTRVLVGGRVIDSLNGQELLSRQVIKVNVPPGAQVLHDDVNQRDMVDVHIATPYGVTHHLLIPVYSAPPPPPKPVVAPAEGFALNSPRLTISYCWQRVEENKGQCSWKMHVTSAVPPLALTWKDATGKSLPFAKTTFAFPNLSVTYTLKATTSAEGSDYPIDTNKLSAAIVDFLNAQKVYDPNNPPDKTTLVTDTIAVTPQDSADDGAIPSHAVKKVAALNNLEVHFQQDPQAAKDGCPPPCPPKPKGEGAPAKDNEPPPKEAPVLRP
jgi:hypothetical protein